MEYKLIITEIEKGYFDESLLGFNILVTDHLIDGWELYGNPYSYKYSNNIEVNAQAVIKKTTKE